MRQNTNEQNRIKKYVYSLYVLVCVLILSLLRAGWYLDRDRDRDRVQYNFYTIPGFLITVIN